MIRITLLPVVATPIATPNATKTSIPLMSCTMLMVQHRLLHQCAMKKPFTNHSNSGIRHTTTWIRDSSTSLKTTGARATRRCYHKPIYYTSSSLSSFRSSQQHRMNLSSSSTSTVTTPLPSKVPVLESTTSLPPPPPGTTAAIGVLGTIFFGSLCVGTFLLGTWQTKRYFEKAKLIQQRNLDLQSKPLTYEEYCNQIRLHQPQEKEPNSTTTTTTTTPASFRKVQLYGRYHHEYEILVGPRGPPPGSTTEGGGMASSPQGYYIITPLELIPNETNLSSTHNSDNNNNNLESPYVLINRGWVPRHMVIGSSSPTNHRQGRSSSSNTKVTNEFVWDRPMGRTSVTVVPTQGEEPRFLVAQHNFSHQPAILYWYDINTMLEIAHPNFDDPDDHSSSNNNNNVDSQQQPTTVLRKKPKILLPYATKVAEKEPDTDNDSSMTRWPISPTAEKVGEFKVSPSVHVGYAMTWYGLSMAGLYMTRLLLLKR